LASSVHELYIPSAESRYHFVWIAAGFLVAYRLERTLHGTKAFEWDAMLHIVEVQKYSGVATGPRQPGFVQQRLAVIEAKLSQDFIALCFYGQNASPPPHGTQRSSTPDRIRRPEQSINARITGLPSQSHIESPRRLILPR
jgi:hypothetical protein